MENEIGKESAPNDKSSKARHYFYIVATLFSSFVFIQNWFLNDKLNTVMKNNDELKYNQKHNEDVATAYKTLALKEAAKKLEAGYLQYRNKEAKYIEFNKTNPCGKFPIELAVAESPVNYGSLEAILAGGAEDKEKTQ